MVYTCGMMAHDMLAKSTASFDPGMAPCPCYHLLHTTQPSNTSRAAWSTWRSTDIHGIGFKTADTLAQRLGIPRDAVIRAQAGVRHVLQTFADEGHCAVVQAELLKAATTLLEIPETIIVQAITLEVQEERLIAEAIDGQHCLLLAPLYRAEVGVATQLLHLLDGTPPWGAIDPAKAIPWVEAQTGRTLATS